jgi:RimJ/RimL family protein N-acetyltransferase
VMRKNGLKFEGTLRGHFKKWGEYLDSEMHSILRSEWESTVAPRPATAGRGWPKAG